MTDTVIKRRVVVSKPGAVLHVERLDLSDDARARLVTGVLQLERGDAPADVLDRIANDVEATEGADSVPPVAEEAEHGRDD